MAVTKQKHDSGVLEETCCHGTAQMTRADPLCSVRREMPCTLLTTLPWPGDSNLELQGQALPHHPLPHRCTLYLTVWNRKQGSFSWGRLQKMGCWWWEPWKDTARPQTRFGVLCACCRMEPELHLCICTKEVQLPLLGNQPVRFPGIWGHKDTSSTLSTWPGEIKPEVYPGQISGQSNEISLGPKANRLIVLFWK